MYDAFGNGITTGKKGWLITYDSEGKEIDKFKPITDFGARSFFTVNESLAIENITVSNENNGKIFSITGRVLNDNDKTERIIIKNGKKYINK